MTSSADLCLGKSHNRVARDILYKAPRLLRPKSTDTERWNSRHTHQLVGFLRTIINKPELADRIDELDLTVVFEGQAEVIDDGACRNPGPRIATHSSSRHFFFSQARSLFSKR
jgi:hypothetical protein